jgi:protein-disulfide isomerase
MKNLPLLIATIFGTLAIIIGVAVMFSNSSSQPATADRTALESNTQLVKGPESAKVTIVEFSDLQCPACRAVQPLINSVVEQYPDDVRLIYRHFPLLDIHPNAMLAAQASEVAADEGKFWEMHDLLFQRQDEWANIRDNQALIDQFGEYAQQIQIDKQILVEKIQTDDIKNRVMNDMALGSQLRVNATPTIYVNGQQLSAPQQLQAVVEQTLNSSQ